MHPFRVEVIVEPYLSGVRIDSFLIKHLRNYTPFRMQRIVRAGAACVDDVPVRIDQRVFARQRVSVALIEPPDKLLEPEPIDVRIVFEDPWLIVVDKQPGLVAHPVGEIQESTLANALQWHLDRQTPVRGLARPGIVHRLDRMTSGLIVVTKDHLSHRRVSIDFQSGRVAKKYLAIVEGNLSRDDGIISLPIGRAPGNNSILMTAKANARDARPAKTGFQVFDRFAGRTLVLCKPYTGRNHQIRVHLAEIGHPVVGDEYYAAHGRIRERGKANEEEGLSRHALHATRLEFAHPITQEWLTFDAPMPADMRAMLEGCDVRT